jgi:hypothetical protein
MDSFASLDEQAKARLDDAAAKLDRALRDPDASALSEFDRRRLVADATQTAQSVRDALQQPDYPLPMRRELVYRLIQQFEESVEETLRKRERPRGTTSDGLQDVSARAGAVEPMTLKQDSGTAWAGPGSPSVTQPDPRSRPESQQGSNMFAASASVPIQPIARPHSKQSDRTRRLSVGRLALVAFILIALSVVVSLLLLFRPF